MLMPSALLATGFMLLVIFWSLLIPFNGAPDEFTHLYLVEYLHRFGAIPRPGIDPAESFVGELSGWPITKDRFWYYGLPFLNSLGAAALTWLFADAMPAQMGFLAARSFNWMLAPVFAVAMVAIARLSGVRGALAWLLPAVFLLIPQVTFIFAYFNADAFALTATTVSLALFLWLLESPQRWKSFVFGLSVGLVLCSKIYYFPSFVFFLCLLALIWGLRLGFPVVRFLSWSTLGMSLIAAPVLIVTYRLFGEVTGLSGQGDFVSMHANSINKMCFFFCEGEIIDLVNLKWWLRTAFMSFFYGLGWMNIFLSDYVYLFFFAPIVIVIFAFSSLESAKELKIINWALRARFWLPAITFLFWSMSAAVVLLNLYGSQILAPQPQGRYLFVILPFALLLVAVLLGSREPPFRSAAGEREDHRSDPIARPTSA